jgi:hypothetical protein
MDHVDSSAGHRHLTTLRAGRLSLLPHVMPVLLHRDEALWDADKC